MMTHMMYRSLFYLYMVVGLWLFCAESVASTKLSMVYVGQGHATVMRDSGKVLVYDVGGYDEAYKYFVPWLVSNGITHLDGLVISHPHLDHYGGLNAIIEEGITIGTIYHSVLPPSISDFAYDPAHYQSTISRAELSGAEIVNVWKGYATTVGGMNIKVIEAFKELSIGCCIGTVNDYSVVLRVTANSVRTLFTGDLNRRAGEKILTNGATSVQLSADVFQVPHHGVLDYAPTELWDRVGAVLNLIPSTALLWGIPRSAPTREWAKGKNHDSTAFGGTVSIEYLDGVIKTQNGELLARDHPEASLAALVPIYFLLLSN